MRSEKYNLWTTTFQIQNIFSFFYSNAALWLVIAGAISLADASLKIYAHFTKSKIDDQYVKKISPGLSLGFFCLVIVGSVWVFGKKILFIDINYL